MTRDVTIHGENCVSLAAMLKYLQLPNHPFHEVAKQKSAEFIERELQRRIEAAQVDMQQHPIDSVWID